MHEKKCVLLEALMDISVTSYQKYLNNNDENLCDPYQQKLITS
jgi:hypothetical protein